MIFENDYKIRIRDIGQKYINNKGLLGILEDIAGLHSASVGLGLYDIEKTNITWVLLDWQLKVISRVKYGEKIHVKTWSRYIYKCYAYRDFEVYNENKELIAIATSKWVMIDVSAGKIAKVQDTIGDKYKSEIGKSVFNILELDKLKEPESYKSSIIYKVCRRDIDIYHHVHNLYYLDLAYEALPQEVYNDDELNNIRIMYKKEIKLGDTVKCLYAYENNKNIIVIKSEDEKTLHAIIELY